MDVKLTIEPGVPRYRIKPLQVLAVRSSEGVLFGTIYVLEGPTAPFAVGGDAGDDGPLVLDVPRAEPELEPRDGHEEIRPGPRVLGGPADALHLQVRHFISIE